ncbi:MAG: flagellar basal body P-ring formation protein FlgA [Ignavibacteriae bacterium]|nr:flagellar basal body P-ring formation protein FlgA [Ignavibacteriota bacterium]
MKNYRVFTIVSLLFFSVVSMNAQSNFSGERLRSAVLSYAQKTVEREAEILISQKIADQTFQEPGVTAKCTGSAQSLRGMSNVGVEFAANGRVIRRIQIPVQVKILQEVPVATATISSNSPISNQKISFEMRDVSAFSDNELLSKSDITGSTAKRFLPKGSIITRSAITDRNGIRAGMPVTIHVQAGNVVIRTRGSVLNDASIGETVRVMREGTNTMLTGTLRENHTVFIGNSSQLTSER